MAAQKYRMTPDQAMARLKAKARPDALPHMARYGIATSNAFGVAVPELRKIAREAKRDHALALALWQTGVHDARLLATMVAEPARVNEAAALRLARDFRSWDLCDQCCLNLYRFLPFAHGLVRTLAAREEEFVKRAGFSLLAVLAVHDKRADDPVLLAFLPLIEAGANDPRLLVRKSVNWALRQIGKRNPALNLEAIAAAERILKQGGPARWVASDAMRELRDVKVQARLRSRRSSTEQVPTASPQVSPRSKTARARAVPSGSRPGRTRRPRG